jgi:hypothetical protein
VQTAAVIAEASRAAARLPTKFCEHPLIQVVLVLASSFGFVCERFGMGVSVKFRRFHIGRIKMTG